MNGKMQMVGALESHYKSILDRHSLQINHLLEQGNVESLDSLVDYIEKYTYVLNQYNFVQKLKQQLLSNEDES